MARPKKTERRDRQLNLSLTQHELDAARSRADEAGMRLTEFARQRVIADQLAIDVPASRQDAARRLVVAQLQRLGNNLNQVARHLHTTSRPLPVDLEPLLRDIRRTIERERSDDR